MSGVAVESAGIFTPFGTGAVQVIDSSAGFDWRGYMMSRQISPAGERQFTHTQHHVIALLCNAPARGEHRNERGHYEPYVKAPGALTLAPVGPVVPIRQFTPAEHVYLAMTPGYLNGVHDEMDTKPETPRFRSGIHDAHTQQLVELLADEMRSGNPNGRLYADSLTHAAAIRFLIGSPGGSPLRARVSALPKHVLSRVCDRIENEMHTDLDLPTLARESGYSREHFLRMFRQATGLTPHQYLMERRVEKALALARNSGRALAEIALECGFASQAHMTTVVRKQTGHTPGRIRRDFSLSRSSHSFVKTAQP